MPNWSGKKRLILSVVLMQLVNVVSAADDKPCACDVTPPRFAMNTKAAPLTKVSTLKSFSKAGMAHIPAGTFMMGGDNDQARPDELPKHTVSLHDFWLDKATVTNAEFAAFVAKTKYVTTAEKKPDWDEIKKQVPPGTPKPADSDMVPASLVFTPPDHAIPLNNEQRWWSWVPGADWRHPRGEGSSIKKVMQHPVVHVSWDDANAYCKSVGKRLATEAEWEWAARGGLKNKIYPWGDEPIDQGTVKANTWQGKFPYKNTMRDKYYYTAPVKSYPANGYGLYDMAGNVWEWVSDWYDRDYYKSVASAEQANPVGPAKSYDPREPYAQKRVLRGGSYLCNEAYCTGYRVAARMKTTPDTSMEHVGFRCAHD